MNEVYAFGPFVLDVGRHVLMRDGRVVALPPKAFELLHKLVSSEGRALSRHELLAALWPNTHVEEFNLTFQVSILRKALGDTAERLIETVPRYGYRFAPHVSPAVHRSAEPARRVPRTAFAAFAVILASTIWLALLRDPAPPAARVPAFSRPPTPLSAMPGMELQPSLSADGTQVAFSWQDSAGNIDVYVKLVGEGEPIRLTSHPEPDLSPAWSPDGRRIAFLRQGPGRGAPASLIVMPALGGTERVVETLTLPLSNLDISGTNLLEWTRDGRALLVGGWTERANGLWLIEVDGRERRRLTTPPIGVDDRSPAISPDGRRMAFVRWSAVTQHSLFTLGLDAGLQPVGAPVLAIEMKPLLVLTAAWAPDGRSLIYSSGTHMGRSRLMSLTLTDDGSPIGSPRVLPVGDQATGLDVAASGRVVYVRRIRDTRFRRFDVDALDISETNGLPESTYDELVPHYGPDGRLAFASSRSGTEEIWIADGDGGNARQMTTCGGPVCANPQWSPDGHRIVFSSDRAESFDLYLLVPSTGEETRLTATPGRDEDFPRWSRDGRWLYFTTFHNDTGRREIRKMPADGGLDVAVSADGETVRGAAAEETHDGSHLVVLTMTPASELAVGAGPNRLMVVPLRGGATQPLLAGVTYRVNFVVGRGEVFAVTRAGTNEPEVLEAVHLATRRRRRIGTFAYPTWVGMALSPDERSIVVSEVAESTTDLMVVDPDS